jgi:tetratricopeptide (TPR) repeat protein
MTSRDLLGLPLSGADDGSLGHYADGIRLLQLFRGDPVAPTDVAIAASPGFVMAHALKAYLHLLGTEPAGLPVAADCLAAAETLPADTRERAHLAAIRHLVAGEWHRAGRVLEDIAAEWPRDALALQVGHQIDFFTGSARMLRDRIARALPDWDAAMPGYHALLGMHAFGLEEMGDYVAAERSGRRAVEMEPRDGWAQHAVAHVYEMQCRQRDGIAWMRADPDAWATDSFLQVHNWWHLALYHLELGEIDEVMALYDGPIYGARSTVILDMLDASAMLWRLSLLGVDVGDRWQAVADAWEPVANAGNYAFNDAHATMAFVGAGRDAAVRAVLEAQETALSGPGDNAGFLRDVGRPVTLAIQAFGAGDYRAAIGLIRPVRNIAARFGGSHAQRDLLDLTLIEAALRAGETALARALVNERRAMRPASPMVARMAARLDGLKAVA